MPLDRFMVFKINPSLRRSRFTKPSPVKNKLFLWITPIIALSLWLGYKQIQSYFVQPDVVFVLGGDEERERFAAKFARQHPDLPIWISGGGSQWYTEKVFDKAGIKRSRLHLDYQAVDTVTNFTTLADKLHGLGVDSVYLITSDDHMNRARVIGEIVFGSRGIIIKPISVPSGRSSESAAKSFRDGIRAIVWVATGYTGASHPQQSSSVKK